MNTEKLFGKKNRIIAAAIAAGIALIIAGGVLSSKENSGVDDGKSAIAGKLEYELQLERRIEELCLSLDGIDSAKALVTLDGGAQTRREISGNPRGCRCGKRRRERAGQKKRDGASFVIARHFVKSDSGRRRKIKKQSYYRTASNRI